ncbi:glutamate-cysteine ligase family protein [Fibrobacter succinogenes]|uniref:Glutamate-cysteine ligase family 2(GCS2) n=1 Tax=Fibrobacter succinogenes TaxID=833 RepID=A0A380RWA1_FIBSU|nr:glutamate-cysteine ligase family protein [Fibrobacter succinogenes]PWJ37039.1 glutamate-cysteine ligase [Fibrobacter succinogenes subsp. elongatus]SUQ19287.1 Glutamate-cysteine ligase family 2(GCS2) [Fibrobacter succinogenes]
MSNYKLWERFGVEMEFMIVDRDTLNVLPRADVPLGKDKDGNQLSDIEYDDIGLSNELVSHVLEFKCAHPKSTFDGLGKRFFHEIRRANKKLEKINAMLLPSACHPFMDPAEMKLWPYDCLDIYQTYDRIFNCKGHGWANLQSTHLNLSFDGDEEFGELHAAIRLLLPLIPAIAASSPYLDGKYTGYRDARIEVYRHNQDKVPEITGQVIPEQAYSYDEYNKMIFDKVKKAIAPYDTEHLLNHFFLNSRGAIARFDRGAIEIRLVDIQECPNADIAIVELEMATLKAIVNGKFAGNTHTLKEYREFLRNFDTTRLAELLTKTTKDAENAVIDWPEFLAVFGMDSANTPAAPVTAGDIWKHIYSVVKNNLTEVSQSFMEKMLERGTLSSALYKALGDAPTHEAFVTEYKKLADCLAHNRLYGISE